MVKVFVLDLLLSVGSTSESVIKNPFRPAEKNDEEKQCSHHDLKRPVEPYLFSEYKPIASSTRTIIFIPQ